MRLALKITNGTWLVLFLLSAAFGIARADGRDSSSLTGLALWVGLSFLTFLAADRPRDAMHRWAVALNVFTLICLGVSMLFVVAAGKGPLNVSALGVVLVVSLPFAFNVYALRKLKIVAESEPHALPSYPAPYLGADVPVTPTESASHSTSSHYVVRHWRGELSLPVAYWINGWLLGFVAFVLLGLVAEVGKNWNLRSTAFAVLGLFCVLTPLTVWSVVGIMRAAAAHPRRGGSPGLALTAQFVTVLGVIAFAVRLATDIGPQIREFATIAFNKDALERIQAVIASNGQSLILRGTLGTGSFEHVSQVLAAAPAVRTVVLDSIGGRLREAEQLAALVRQRKLNTYVEGMCLSACTYVFIAGQDRAATPNAKIGFHSPSFAGTTDTTSGLGAMLSYYRTAGISEPFLTRIRGTSADDMWYPTRDELIDNGVLNRVSLGGETASLGSKVRSRSELALAFKSIPLIGALDKRFPGTIDKAVDASWAAYEKGANDAEVTSAGRAIVAQVYPKLLLAADDAGLDGFLNLTIHQLTAARDLGPKACGLFLDSKLDPTKVFPLALIQEEMSWGLKQLEAPARTRAAVTQSQFQTALQPLIRKLDPAIFEVIGAPEKFADQPKRRCDATLAFYQAVAAQPPKQRRLLLRGMFQAEQ